MGSPTFKSLGHMVVIAVLVFVQNWVVYHRGNDHHQWGSSAYQPSQELSADTHFEDHGHTHHGDTPGQPHHHSHVSSSKWVHTHPGGPGKPHQDHSSHSFYDHELSPVRLGKGDSGALLSLTWFCRKILLLHREPDPVEDWTRYTLKLPLLSGHRHQDQPRAPPFVFVV